MKIQSAKILAAFLVALFFFTPQSFAAKKANLGIPNFWEVEPGLYRGGQPKKAGYETLKRLGVKTIIDLRADRSVRKEKAWAEAEGIRFISLPWRTPETYSSRQVYTFLQLARNSKNRPLFVHCKAGKDRIGFMMAAYRMYVHDWTEKEALREMKRLGYHGFLYPNLKRDLHRFAQEIGKDSKKSFLEIVSTPLFAVKNATLKLWNGFFSAFPLSSLLFV